MRSEPDPQALEPHQRLLAVLGIDPRPIVPPSPVPPPPFDPEIGWTTSTDTW